MSKSALSAAIDAANGQGSGDGDRSGSPSGERAVAVDIDALKARTCIPLAASETPNVLGDEAHEQFAILARLDDGVEAGLIGEKFIREIQRADAPFEFADSSEVYVQQQISRLRNAHRRQSSPKGSAADTIAVRFTTMARVKGAHALRDTA